MFASAEAERNWGPSGGLRVISFEDGDPDVQEFLKKVMKIQREHLLEQQDSSSQRRREVIRLAAVELVRKREAKKK